MPKSQKLWNIWFITYLCIINAYLTYVSIKDYLDFKHQILDMAYGKNWKLFSVYIVLACLNISLALLPIIIYMNVVPQGNLANDGYILGKHVDIFHLTVDEQGRGRIFPIMNNRLCCCVSPTFRLLYMEIPPVSHILHVLSAMCFLIPRSFMEAQRIHHGVLRLHHIWHSDLDFIFDPDQQHADFLPSKNGNYIQPVSVAYFNFCLSLILLSLQYSRVLWHISRRFTLLLSFVMILWTVHVLVEFCSISVLIKVSLNPGSIAKPIEILLGAFKIQLLYIGGNVILLFSFSTIFHYGLLQYADTMIHKSRRSHRQMLNTLPQMIGSNPSVSDNNFSDSSVEPVFSNSPWSHILAIVGLCGSMTLKAPNHYLAYVHFYEQTSDHLALTNMVLCVLFVIMWLMVWFALALRRTWNFTIKSDTKATVEPLSLNGNFVPTHSGTMQLQSGLNSHLSHPKSSDNNLSKRMNVALDGCSDDTDMSSSNNYVFLHSMRNSLGDSVRQGSAARNPLYLTYALNNQGLSANNTVFTNEDSINNRLMMLDDQLGSEHSFSSNRSRNMGFENMPPILSNFDDSRYKNLNPNSVAIEKLIPRYLRHPTSEHPEFMVPSTASAYESGIQTLSNNILRYKQSGSNNPPRSTDKYSTLQASTKSTFEPMDFLLQNSDDEIQRRVAYNGDCRRVLISSNMFPMMEESVTENLLSESDFLLPRYRNEGTDFGEDIRVEDLSEVKESTKNDSVNPVDRMCSEV